MKPLSRRALLKSSLLAPAAVAVQQMGPLGMAMQTGTESGSPAPAQEAPNTPLTALERERLLLDFGWRFHLGNADDPNKDFGLGVGSSGDFQKTGNFLAATNIAFDDGDWTPINLPHDWAIELPFTNDPELASKGFYPLGRTYPATSVGWYRRVFELPASDAGKRISLEFDGSYRESLVALNGFYIGQHSGGYDPFSFDVTDFVNPGATNVLLVRVDATLSDGWFYEGAGIYRHVWLAKTSPVHVKKWGTFVSSEVRSGEAALSIRTEVENQSGSARSVHVVSTVLDPSGRTVASATSAPNSVSKGSEETYEQKLTVQRPQLWSLEERNLYKLVTKLRADGVTVDRYETPFGIRAITIDPEKGVFLNGQHVKIKGTCNHQDHAGIGAALPDSVQYYRVRKLQEMGCNSLRTSHNPPTPELLDACDRLGMLVFDETRMMSSNPKGLSQFGDLVRRDRNRPSVFMWSMGNEERVANTERGVLILSAMKALAAELDGTRPVSIAPTGAIGTGGLAVCDVIGYNYMDPGALAYHEAHPGKPVIGTETVSAVCTRGIYITDPQKGYVSSYDPYTTNGRASAEGWWRFCDAQPWLAGGFVWTGFDYRGEPSPYQWPNISSQYGIIDTCGFPKDTFYYYQSWWTDKPVLHLFPHWNWPGYEGKEIAVWVHTNLDRVELFHNGRSVGMQDVKKNQHLAWNVPYAAGAIEARGYKGNKLVMTTRRDTTGAAAKLVMSADRHEMNADGEDVTMFTVAVHDAQGRVVPIADNEITFQVSGSARLIGVGNGDPTDHESDKGSVRKAFSGLCMAIIQSTKKGGDSTVLATSPGLAPATVTIATREVSLRPQIAVWQREVPAGAGVTGLWRPVPQPAGANELVSFLVGAGSTIFTLLQNGNTLTGTVEGGGGGFLSSGELPIPIENGTMNGSRVSFKAGNSTYTGSITADRISLERRIELPFHVPHPVTPKGPQPAIGPAPDGSDPSFNRSWRMPASITVVLQRVER
jgi:beta-galactosidase